MLKAVVLCLLIGGSGVGYVWQKEQIERLSNQIDDRAARLARILDENENRKRLLAKLNTVEYLEARIKELNLGLAQPQPGQLWHLTEPPREWPPLPGEQQLALHNHTRPAGALHREDMTSP